MAYISVCKISPSVFHLVLPHSKVKNEASFVRIAIQYIFTFIKIPYTVPFTMSKDSNFLFTDVCVWNIYHSIVCIIAVSGVLCIFGDQLTILFYPQFGGVLLTPCHLSGMGGCFPGCLFPASNSTWPMVDLTSNSS